MSDTLHGGVLDAVAAKFGLSLWVVDRLYRRIRVPPYKTDARHRLELVCLATVTRHLQADAEQWLRQERTPVDDALDEASRDNPRWTWFDWDCGEDHDPKWSPVPGDRVRVFTRDRRFIGYARVVYWGDLRQRKGRYSGNHAAYSESHLDRQPPEMTDEKWREYVRKTHATESELRFEDRPPEWATLPTAMANVGRVLPA